MVMFRGMMIAPDTHREVKRKCRYVAKHVHGARYLIRTPWRMCKVM